MADAGPCKACPWRASNQGKRHPDGWYTQRNLARLWAGLRRGEDMSCHPTDPNNPVSDKALAAGSRPAPEHSEVRECAGALILRQRELMVVQQEYSSNFAAYRRARPRGLTIQGIAALVERAMFGGTLLGGRKMPRPDLDDADVSVPWLTWTPKVSGRGADRA